MKDESHSSAYYHAVLNTMPIPVFVVDDDVRILDFNEAAGRLLKTGRKEVLRKRGGEILHCIHATEVPEGCGHAKACRSAPPGRPFAMTANTGKSWRLTCTPT